VERNRAERRKKEARNRAALLIVLDIACISVSFLVAYWVRLQSGLFVTQLPIQPIHLYALLTVCALWVIIFAAHGLYRRETYLSVFDQMVGIFNSVNVGVLVILATAFVTKTNYFLERRLVLVLAWAFSILLANLVRVVIFRSWMLRNIQRDPLRCRVVIVGVGESGHQFVRLVRHTMNHVYEIAGFVDDDPERHGKSYEGVPVLGAVSDLETLVERERIERIFVAVQSLPEEEMIDLISRCMRAGVPVKTISDQFRMFSSDTTLERVDGIPTVGVRENRMQGPAYIVKRAFDLVTASVLTILLLPVFSVLAIMIKAFSPGPVLFRQMRVGQNAKTFEFYKFRTMRPGGNDKIHRDYAAKLIEGEDLNLVDEESKKPVFKMTRDPRITPIGAVLRRTSLDELPQLFNVIKGEMSLVGPRPPIEYELQYYREWHKRRLMAKPGLTGLWQVSGRSMVPFNEMVLLDLYYIDHWSLKLDLEILLRTIPVILFGKGAY
jgi:exopolysaccharide biosynthesis polyprenyl glycosylphosphotransferase